MDNSGKFSVELLNNFGGLFANFDIFCSQSVYACSDEVFITTSSVDLAQHFEAKYTKKLG